MIHKKTLVLAAILGALGVATGAFGAHGLKAMVDAEQLATWQTAVSYQFYHTFALLFLSLLPVHNKLLNAARYCFVAGIFLFSGSLYLLALKTAFGMPWVAALGPVTPLGGLFFIAGWLLLVTGASKLS